MEKHNIRAVHGREKGRFVSKSKYRWRQNVLASKKKAAPPAVSDVPDFEICGRRIVELKTLALNLWCIACDIPLSLRYVKSEQKFGLASVLDVKCVKCNKIYTIHTNKYLLSERLYHVNLKAATAMIDGGIGESQLNIILSALDIPSFSTATLKRNERIVGPAIERVARNSCREAIKVEKSLTVAASITPEAELSNNPERSNDEENSITMAEVNQEESVKIVVSYDAGWQKRGTGRAYNSLSGQGSLIGHRSKLILGYAVRCKACAFCARGHSPDDHDCRKNYEGSAKSMEPDMAVELIVHNQHLKDENVCVNVLIGDDDSSTIAAVRRESTTRIDKWSDLNHASKAMINALYGLKLPTKIIEYFSRCFTCAIKKNEGNPEAVKGALKNVVSHAFGSHERCGEWCRYSSMGEKYQHKGLPHGKPLSDPQLKSAFTSVFTRFANNSDKLAPCGSSQGNESFNSSVASKAPKSKYYGASESLNFRVAASVCQKNIGVTYIEQIYKELNLSPSTVKFRESKENVRKRKIENLRTVEAKRRRLFHKKNRSSKMASVQRREGITYETDSGLNSVSGFIDESPYQADTSDHQDAKIVIFDLETTGLSKSSEICQIAAVHEKETFNVYIVPAGGMSSRAAEVTGLQIHGGEMFLNDQQVDTTPPQMAFKNFIAYLRSIGNSIILTAHNGFRFDAPLILRHMKKFGLLEEFQSVVIGFADTLHLFRNLLPNRKKEKKRYTQTALAEDLLGSESIAGAHNAVTDVSILKRLVYSSGITDDMIKKTIKTTGEILRAENNAVVHAHNKITLESLKDISAGMKTKMAKAGITLEILEKTFADFGPEGIRMLLCEDVRGKPRVTKKNQVLMAIVQQLE